LLNFWQATNISQNIPMNTELIDLSQTRKEIKIEIAPDDVRRVYDSVSKKYADKAQVPGFRKGLAPLDVVRMRFKKEIQADVIQEILPPQVTLAIQEHQLSPLTEPQLQLEDPENVKVNGSQPLSFSVLIEIMPDIADPDYEGLEAVKRIRPVKEEEIENVIDEHRQQESTFIPVEDRKSQDGDMVIVDLKGRFEDDPDADPIEVNDLEVKLGDEVVEKSFSDNLLGVEVDSEKEFAVDYPKDFSTTALAGRTVNYKANVKSVGTVELPELNDEWVKSLDQGFKTLKELREKLREDMETVAKADADSRVRNDLIAKLIEKNDFEVPNALIESQARRLLNNFAQDLAQRGVDLKEVQQDFIETTYSQMRLQAVRDVRGALLLEKIAEKEGIEITKESVDEEIEKMAEHYQTTVEEFRKNLESQGGEFSIENNLRTREAVEKLVENSTVTDGEWADENLNPDESAEDVSSEKDADEETKAESGT